MKKERKGVLKDRNSLVKFFKKGNFLKSSRILFFKIFTFFYIFIMLIIAISSFGYMNSTFGEFSGRLDIFKYSRQQLLLAQIISVKSLQLQNIYQFKLYPQNLFNQNKILLDLNQNLLDLEFSQSQIQDSKYSNAPGISVIPI